MFGDIGAIILTNNPLYPAITFQISLSNTINLYVVNQILTSFSYTK